MSGKRRKSKKCDISETYPDDHELDDRAEDYDKEQREIEKSTQMSDIQ